MKLFNDSDESDNDEVSKIEIDEEYARRYEHNKKREDLHRLEELKKKGVVDDSGEDSDDESESEDDDDLMNSRDNDLAFFDALIKVKKKDPILKEKDAKLFADESEDEDDEEGEDNVGKEEKKKKKEGKAMYLKDVVAKHLIEDGPEYAEEGEREGAAAVKSYADEQEEIRRAFLDAAREGDDDDDESGGLLKEKGKEEEGDDIGDGSDRDEMIQNKLDEYFGDDDELDENAKFLKDFFKNTMWVDKEKGKKVLDEELEMLSDQEEIDKQEDYEREFNFRYQENAGDRVLGHSRVVEGSVRKKENARKVQRKSKEDRMAIAELERKEELKHLKNLKKEEYLEKIKKVREVAGISDGGVFVLNKDDLEEEYDPKEHDRKMKEMFNDDYYGAEDVNPEFCSDDEEEGDDFKKPDFDKEDELLGLPKGWDDQQEEEEEEEEEVEVEKEEEMVHGERQEGKRKRKRKPSLLEKVALEEDLDEKHKKELEDELYKLDYEGTVGDLKTRFPYRKVQPKRFGLSAEEILMMDDGELNQYVSLKKIAPYREKEWKVPSMKRYEQKMKNKELLQGGKLGEQKKGKKKSLKDDGQRSLSVKDGLKDEKAEVDGDSGNVSRKSKRRHRQAELKLPQSRRKAYGEIPPKSKHKTKQ